MDDTFDLGPVPTRLTVDGETVSRLVRDQLPQWSDLPVTPVEPGGWDNRTFRLGTDLLVRLPSAAEYAEAVAKEQHWLPVLAPRLPLPIPVPLAQGGPSADYPYPWSVYRWLDGEPVTADRIADPVRFATDLAGFLRDLRAVDPSGGPQPGIHNWFRGGPLRTYAADTDEALGVLGDRVDADRAGTIWAEALEATWDGADGWFHGDVARGNLLVDDDGRLCAVIDFGTCGVGDPACDLAVAWTLLTDDGRAAFREALEVDEASWRRGRGWALWKALITCAHSLDPEDPEDAADLAESAAVLHTILRDHAAT